VHIFGDHDSAKIEWVYIALHLGESLPTTRPLLRCPISFKTRSSILTPGGKSQALGKFGWESTAWLNRGMRALVFS
jgi:hypothetical protein